MITIERNRFLQALALCREVVKSKSTLPVLACVRLAAVDGVLQVRATDLDSEIGVDLEIKAPAKFLAVVSVVKLSCFLAVCDAPEVSLEVKKNMLHVTCGDASAELLCVDAEEFPATKSAECAGKGSHEFSSDELLSLLHTSFCASPDATRYILNGLFFTEVDGVLAAVATDGKRLAVRRSEIPAAEDLAAVVPTGAVKLLSAALRSKLVDGVVDLSFSESRVSLAAGAVQISSKLIEGTFPNWQQVVPAERRGIVFSPARLISAVERAAALQQDSVQIELKGTQVRVLGEKADVGSAEDKYVLDLGGVSSVVWVNADYLLQGLKWVEASDAEIDPGNGMEPVVLKASGGAAKYVVMPLRTPE
jgi:DNA polymerase-3 subunit beta